MRQQLVQQGPQPGTIRTKKYQLSSDLYTQMAFKRLWKKQRWVPVALGAFGVALALVWHSWWVLTIVLTLALLHILFWGVQVTGVTKLEQTKFLFEKMFYDISPQRFLMMRNEREGAELKWDFFDKAERLPEGFLLTFSTRTPAGAPQPNALQRFMQWMGAGELQFLYLPYEIFVKPADLKLMESALKRKGLLPGETV